MATKYTERKNKDDGGVPVNSKLKKVSKPISKKTPSSGGKMMKVATPRVKRGITTTTTAASVRTPSVSKKRDYR